MRVSDLIQRLVAYVGEHGDEEVRVRTQSYSLITQQADGDWMTIPLPGSSMLQGESVEGRDLDVRRAHGLCAISGTMSVACLPEKGALDHLWSESRRLESTS